MTSLIIAFLAASIPKWFYMLKMSFDSILLPSIIEYLDNSLKLTPSV